MNSKEEMQKLVENLEAEVPTLEKSRLYNPISGFDAEERILAKSPEQIRVASYNILISFLYKAAADTSPELLRLSWEYRKELVTSLIKKINPDILSLQEVTLEQIKFLHEHLSAIYGFMGFAANTGHALTEITETEDYGEIVPILFNKERFNLLAEQVFWLSQTPDRVSTGWDASRPRIMVCGFFQDKVTGKSFIMGNTHYDHRGGAALLPSGKLEISALLAFKKKHNADFVVFSGDRNCFKAGAFTGGEQWYQDMMATPGIEDIRNCGNHYGLATTFLGYSPDKFKTKCDETGIFAPTTLDLIFVEGQGSKVVKSMCSPGEYSVPEESKTPVLQPLFGAVQNPKLRFFASDHAMVAADIEIEPERIEETSNGHKIP